MPPTPDESNHREALRYLISKRWRSKGIAWTDAQMDAAIDAAIKKAPAAELVLPPAAPQGELFDTGCNAKETRALAAKASKRGSARRREAIRDFVLQTRYFGATRIEIARGLGVEINFVTRPVLDLIEAGDLIETARRRDTPSGCTAAVIVARAYADREASRAAR